MMLPSHKMRILVVTQPVDFRKGHDGLWAGEGPAYMKIGGRVVCRIADIEAFERDVLNATSDQGAWRPMREACGRRIWYRRLVLA